MQVTNRKAVLVIICGFLLGTAMEGIGYNFVSEAYMGQRATASYALGLENFNKGSVYEALVLFSISAGIKPNYEAYQKIGTIYSQLGQAPAAAAMLESSLALLERREMIVVLEESSLLRAKTQIKEELAKVKQ